MPTGADLRGETAYLAESHPKGVRFLEVPSEELGSLSRKRRST